jgi:hypothetical protein
MITFNPMKVVEYPFGSPGLSSPRREVFPEYYFKTAFFGEFTFRSQFELIVRAIVIAGILLIPFLVLGAYKALRFRRGVDLPMLIVAGTMISGQAAWVWREPYACSQDFRYYIIIIIPLMYMIGRGIDSISGPLHLLGNTLIKIQIVNTGVLLGMLCYF